VDPAVLIGLTPGTIHVAGLVVKYAVGVLAVGIVIAWLVRRLRTK
jgi:hypothetical protein